LFGGYFCFLDWLLRNNKNTVALTKTSKRTTRDHKAKYIQEVRDSIDQHDSVYLFSYENMRSSKFKDIRMHFRPKGASGGGDEDEMGDSEGGSGGAKIMLGKNKLLQIALGRTTEDEYAENLRHMTKHITESVGLLFTSQPHSEVEEFFANFVEPDFARAGFVAPRDVVLDNDMLASQPVTMLEQQFKKQGLPIDIDNGKLVLRNGKEEYKLCKKGEILSPEKCNALMQFGIQLSEFRVQLVCRWSKEEFELLG
jgi:mRNA turnover protein 4